MAIEREVQGFIEAIKHRIHDAVAQPAFQRDPELIRKAIPVLEKVAQYFDARVSGFDHLPEGGPFLMVGNHSGGLYTPDAYLFLAHWYQNRPIEEPAYALMHSIVFPTPLGPIMRAFGALPASFDNAEQALRDGAPVLVYPGGDHEAFRPWQRRNQIDFGGRMGFIRLALKLRVPVVPLVTHGSHQSTIVLARGQRVARMLGLERVRVKIFPFILGFPWGVVPGFIPSIPLPSRISTRIIPALDWSHIPADRADDPEVLRQCYDEITTYMQEHLDDMARERPWPLLDRGLQRLRRVA